MSELQHIFIHTQTLIAHKHAQFASGIRNASPPEAFGVLSLHLRTQRYDIRACGTTSFRQCLLPGMSPGLSLVLATWDGPRLYRLEIFPSFFVSNLFSFLFSRPYFILFSFSFFVEHSHLSLPTLFLVAYAPVSLCDF